MESIEDKLLISFTKKFGRRPKLSDGLAYIGVDSMGMAELTCELEEEFAIQVGDDILNADTVQDLANYIRERQAANE